MLGRKFSAGTGYRYGFNGKENDNEVKGEGNQQDYGMRVYDPRLGKFLSVDPLVQKFPWYSPYQYAGNMPVRCADIDGGEPIGRTETWVYCTWTVLKTGNHEQNGLDMSMGWNWTYDAVYDKASKQAFYVHHGNDGKYYYWNAPDPTLMTYDKQGNPNGHWEQFKTANQIDAEAGAKSADLLSAFWAATISTPFFVAAGTGIASISVSSSAVIGEETFGETYPEIYAWIGYVGGGSVVGAAAYEEIQATESAVVETSAVEAEVLTTESTTVETNINNKIYDRPSSFRIKTLKDAWDAAEEGTLPNTKKCPTCGTNVEGNPYLKEKRNGENGWNASHYPSWNNRNMDGLPTRKDVIDKYNEGVNLECRSCNRSRQDNDHLHPANKNFTPPGQH